MDRDRVLKRIKELRDMGNSPVTDALWYSLRASNLERLLKDYDMYDAKYQAIAPLNLFPEDTDTMSSRTIENLKNLRDRYAKTIEESLNGYGMDTKRDTEQTA